MKKTNDEQIFLKKNCTENEAAAANLGRRAPATAAADVGGFLGRRRLRVL